jgi:16S rRNA processing protein RimM
VLVGRVVGVFGVKGELKVSLETDRPERLAAGKSIWLKMPGGEPARKVRIERSRPHKTHVLVKLQGVDDMTAAEALRGAELRFPQSELPKLPEGEFYIHDIVGLRVVTEDGRDLGEITEVRQSAANDVYVTEKAMIPALRDVVVGVDLKARKMIVRPMPGMLEEE